MIDRATIERILNAADIVEVVSEFVTLRRAGTNWKGLCPFHNEKTPSFMVSPSKGICKCFSCGKGGNVVHFLMLHEQLTYPEALRWLAKKYNIEVKERELTPEDIRRNNLRESLLVVTQWACDYFQHNLYDTEEGQAVALTYFRGRGLRDDTIRTFRLGYCLQSRDALSGEALRKGFNEDFLIDTGLCLRTDEGRLKDKCRGRVVFPIQALDGKVIAFGARTLSSDKHVAKYINSPESQIYHKSDVLYGIYQAKAAIQQTDRCYLVEGYMDVIAMHQSGIKNVVASSGTSLTHGQIRLIHRFTGNLTILYDGDMAGIRASLRGIDMLLEEGMNIRVLLLPDGDDPDSFARKHSPKEYQDYMESHQVDFIRFKAGILLQDAQSDPIKKSQVMRSIVESIAVIPDALTRSTYIKECSALLDEREEALVYETTRIRQQLMLEERKRERQRQYREAQEQSVTSQEGKEPADNAGAGAPVQQEEELDLHPSDVIGQKELQLVKTIVRYGEIVMAYDEDENGEKKAYTVISYIQSELESDGLAFTHPVYARILREAVENQNQPGFTASRYFMQHPDSAISRLAAHLLSDRYQLSENFAREQRISSEAEKLNESVPIMLVDLKMAIVATQMKSILKSLQDPAVYNDAELYTEKMKQYQDLKEIQKALASAGGDRTITV
ncbi:MAG TPA: DNA primase [Prevotellaceae bacterium]|nr:DNA primase [Prevotellaceae bacterium]